MTNNQSPETQQDSDEILLSSMTRLLRQMAWIWVGFLCCLGLIIFFNFSNETIRLIGISKSYFFFTLVFPLSIWSLISFHIIAVARGLETDFSSFERRAKIIGYLFLIAWAPLLSYQAWHLLKKLKQYDQQG